MTKFILIILGIILKLTAVAQTNCNCSCIKDGIKQTRAIMDSIKFSENMLYQRNQIDSLNIIIENYLKQLAENKLFQSCDVNLKYNFYYLLSSDKKLCISSWDTQQGGSMIDFTNTVIYETKNGTQIEKLYYGEKEHPENTKIMFDSIISITTTKNESIYLAIGSGKFSSSLPFKVIRAFMIKDSLVQNFNLFPLDIITNANDQYSGSSLWLMYDRNEFKMNDKVEEFVFIDEGNKILVPIIDKNGRSSKQYYTLFFDGEKFIR